MKRANAAGSDGGAVPPRPPLAHAGARWTTTSTFTPRAFSARTSASSDATRCGLSWPCAGSMPCHDAHSRTQSAPSRSALRGSGFVCPSVWLMPVSTACAGTEHARSAASTTAPASRERRPITFKVSAQAATT